MSRTQSWKWNDPQAPPFSEDFEILQQAVLQVTDIKHNHNKYYALELHEAKTGQPLPYRYRIFTHYGRTDDLEKNPTSGHRECRYFPGPEQAKQQYQRIYRQKTSARKGYKELSLASCRIGSSKAQGQSSGQLDAQTIERMATASTPAKKKRRSRKDTLPTSLTRIVNYIYDEALDTLLHTVQATITTRGIETPLGVLTLGQIEKGRELLQQLYKQIQRKAKRGRQHKLESLSSDFYTVIPHRLGRTRAAAQAAIIQDLADIQQKQETLQLMEDMLQINGAQHEVLYGGQVAQRYQALNCDIKVLSPQSRDFQKISSYVHDSQIDTTEIQVKRVYKLQRQGEHEQFTGHLSNQRLLFHGSRIQHWAGILSRGLQLPEIALTKGVHRTDEGWLGNGIYFGDTSCTGSFYTSPGRHGTSLMAVATVALGRVKTFDSITYGLEGPPKGYNSCQGLRDTEFEDDEFVIYQPNQQKLEYLVEFASEY